MLKKALLGAGMLIVAAGASGGSPNPVRLKTDAGTVVGLLQDNVNVFKGVPYAMPPLGDLRWRPPQRPARWAGERSATEYALPCAQPIGPDGKPNPGGVSGPSGEDCLYLNVWAPKNARKAPVMLWLYGGAGFFGAGSLQTYDGSAFARQGVIVVTINYRLGMLGQFAHPSLTKAAKPGEPLANYQLMDAIAALQWVRRNGKALGADTGNVTLFGQSAGAVMVGALLSTPPSKGLFQKAIIQSAVPLLGGGRTMAQAEADGVRFADVLGLAGANANPAELRALPVDKVISTAARGPGFSNGSYLILDGRVRTVTTGQGLQDGTTVDIPLMIGSTKAEFFGDSVYALANAAARRNKSPVWQYFFDYVPEALKDKLPKGPPHASELPFVFDTLNHSRFVAPDLVTDQDRLVARQVNSCWIAFAKAPVGTRTLKCDGGFDWGEHTIANDAIALFGREPLMTKAKPLIDQNRVDFPQPPGVGEPQ